MTSTKNMYPALSKVLVDFIDNLKSEGKLKLWYTSLKNNDRKPSFRVCFQVEDDDEQYVQSKFQAFMAKNQTELGWTEKFIEPDPNVPDSIQRLQEINKACELVLSITNEFPRLKRRKKRKEKRKGKGDRQIILDKVNWL